MSKSQDRVEERILALLTKGLHFVFKSGERGDWGDVRSTSHAILLLSDFVSERHRAWVHEPAQWLLQQLRPEYQESENHSEMKSWESEVWDTSLAIRAVLSASVDLHEKLIPSLQWVIDVRSKSSNRTWHDEPWETAHALFAIFEARKADLIGKSAGSLSLTEEDLRVTIDWYSALQDKTGKVITPHYTAFLLSILEMALGQFTNNQLLAHYKQALRRSIGYFMNSLDGATRGGLWTSEAWSNGYVLQSLCHPHTFEPLYSSSQRVEKIVNWFDTTKERNKTEGYWGGETDMEDTAVALQSLWNLLVSIREITLSQGRDEIKEQLRKEIMTGLDIPPRPPKKWLVRPIEDGYIIYLSKRNRKIIKWIFRIVVGIVAIAGLIVRFDDLVGLVKRLFSL